MLLCLIYVIYYAQKRVRRVFNMIFGVDFERPKEKSGRGFFTFYVTLRTRGSRDCGRISRSLRDCVWGSVIAEGRITRSLRGHFIIWRLSRGKNSLENTSLRFQLSRLKEIERKRVCFSLFVVFIFFKRDAGLSGQLILRPDKRCQNRTDPCDY